MVGTENRLIPLNGNILHKGTHISELFNKPICNYTVSTNLTKQISRRIPQMF